MNSLVNGGDFLINTLFGLFIMFLLIRFWMHIFHADFRNPIGNFLVQISNPLLLPFKSLISSNRGFAIAVFGTAAIITAIKIFILASIDGRIPALIGLLILVLADLMKTSIYIFMGAMIIRVISSWIAPQGGYNPILSIAHTLSEPLAAPARRIIPAISGIDLSPILVFILLQLGLIVLVEPLFRLAATFA